MAENIEFENHQPSFTKYCEVKSFEKTQINLGKLQTL